MRACVVLLLLGMPLLASGESVAASLKKAEELYKALDYEGARDVLLEVQRARKNAEEAVDFSVLEGVLQAALGNAQASKAAFQRAFRLNPNARLRLKVPPRVSQQFEALRPRAKRPVRVAAAPSDASRPEDEVDLGPDDALGTQEGPADRGANGDSTASTTTASRDVRLSTPEPAAPEVVPAPGPARQVQRKRSDVRQYWWIPSAVGVAAAGVGVYFAVQAKGNYDKLVNPAQSPGVDGQKIKDAGQTQQTVAAVCLSVAVAGLATGVGLAVFGGGASGGHPVALTVTPVPGGAWAGVSATLP